MRKNSEIIKQKQDYITSPRDLVENARKEASILENGHSAIHQKLKSTTAKPYGISVEQMID
jgi:hypothetical protein